MREVARAVRYDMQLIPAHVGFGMSSARVYDKSVRKEEEMRGAYGRLDWMRTLGMWRVKGYTKGPGETIKEVDVGCRASKEEAQQLLRDWYADNKLFVRYA